MNSNYNYRASVAVFPEFSLSAVREIFVIFLVNFTPLPTVMAVETFVFLLYIQCSMHRIYAIEKRLIL